jgi:hypothetical protein
VTGIPIGSPDNDAFAAGAPGLHGAGQRAASPALTITITALALLLALGGGALERSRREVLP